MHVFKSNEWGDGNNDTEASNFMSYELQCIKIMEIKKKKFLV